MAVVGEREAAAGTVALRGRVEGEMEPLSVEGAIAYLKDRSREPEPDLSTLYT
jgi:threonyl-tRNA synthetase